MDSQLEAVRQDIRDVKAKIAKTEQNLAAAEQTQNVEKEKFLSDLLLSLNNQLSGLQDKENILLRNQAPSRGLEQLNRDALYSTLSATEGHVDNKVLDLMVHLYAAALPWASEQLLSQYYKSAKASPLSSTKASLREDEGLVFNGAFMGGTPSRAVLLIAFENGAMPVLCKFAADPQAIVHEFNVLEDLWQEPAVPGIVGPVKLLKANPKGRSHGQVAAPGTMHRHILARHQ